MPEHRLGSYGFAAYVLASNPAIMALDGAERTKAWKTKLYSAARLLKFGRDYEGFGLPS